MNFGQAVRHCRTVVGLTQVELAERAGLSGSYINKLETGKRNIGGSFLAICAALDISPLTLIFLAMEETEKQKLGRQFQTNFWSFVRADLYLHAKSTQLTEAGINVHNHYRPTARRRST